MLWQRADAEHGHLKIHLLQAHLSKQTQKLCISCILLAQKMLLRRVWVERVASLGAHRHMEVRRAAERTLATLYQRVDQAAVQEAIAMRPSEARAALWRGVQVMQNPACSLLDTLTTVPCCCRVPIVEMRSCEVSQWEVVLRCPKSWGA